MLHTPLFGVDAFGFAKIVVPDDTITVKAAFGAEQPGGWVALGPGT